MSGTVRSIGCRGVAFVLLMEKPCDLTHSSSSRAAQSEGGTQESNDGGLFSL